MSISSLHLKKGISDATVISCSSDAYIGDFYICYSKNLGVLKKLDVDNRQCCLCSNEASYECNQKFPNWRVEYTERQNKSTCLLKLRNVIEEDSGFYQCRVYELIKHPCKRRYGTTYNCTVFATPSNNFKSQQSIMIIEIVVSAIVGVGIIIIIILCVRNRKKIRSK